jgi:hypothetical protein
MARMRCGLLFGSCFLSLWVRPSHTWEDELTGSSKWTGGCTLVYLSRLAIVQAPSHYDSMLWRGKCRAAARQPTSLRRLRIISSAEIRAAERRNGER